jgi:CRISPR-associated exonuclease Cas4
MQPPESATPDESEWGDRLPISALNQLMYCERRCALIHIEGVFFENAFTVEGRLEHDAVDESGHERRAGTRLVFALPLYSRSLRLSGRADVVEFRSLPDSSEQPYPVEHKHGKKNQWDNDDVQLCAQALCLEEMLGVPVPAGAIFHAGSRRRREVNFVPELRRTTMAAAARLHELVNRGQVPRAQLLPRCSGCSLRDVCLPEAFSAPMAEEANRCFVAE